MRKREGHKIEPRIPVPFMLELEHESKIITKKLLVIKEICSLLPPVLDARKVCQVTAAMAFCQITYYLQIIYSSFLSKVIATQGRITHSSSCMPHVCHARSSPKRYLRGDAATSRAVQSQEVAVDWQEPMVQERKTAATTHTTAPSNHTRPSPRKHSPDGAARARMQTSDYSLLVSLSTSKG